MKPIVEINETNFETEVPKPNQPAKVCLRLFILGATGRTGRTLAAQAGERGHQITAFVRSSQKLGELRQRVTVRQGDPRSVAELREALAGHDAVVSALGPPALGRTTILRDAARNTVAAMQAEGVRRLLVVSMGALFQDAGILAALLRSTVLRNVAEDAAEMERVVMASELDWTIVRPPRLTNGQLTGDYQVKDGYMPHGRLSLSRPDVAHFLLGEVERGEHVRRIVGIA
jgi:putative NADH-flavin reductase